MAKKSHIMAYNPIWYHQFWVAKIQLLYLSTLYQGKNMALLFKSNCFIFSILLFFTNQCIWRPKSIFSSYFMTCVCLKLWSRSMSHSFSRLEWQPLVVQSVFVASSFSPRSMRSGNECNWSFLVSVVCRAVCSLWRRFSEICAPSLPVGTRQTQEMGSVRNYQALLRQMKIRLAKAKLQVLHVVSEM